MYLFSNWFLTNIGLLVGIITHRLSLFRHLNISEMKILEGTRDYGGKKKKEDKRRGKERKGKKRLD